MNKLLERFVKTARMYANEADYVLAAQRKMARPLTMVEKKYILDNAVAGNATKGSQYLWNKNAARIVGTFNICDRCFPLVRKQNDILNVVKSRVGDGHCEICGNTAVLRKVAVDNYGKRAEMVIKQAQTLNRGDVVKIVDAPTKFNALIGDMAEIINVSMNPAKGVVYELELSNGRRIPYEFKHSQVELPVNEDSYEEEIRGLTDVDRYMEDASDFGDVTARVKLPHVFTFEELDSIRKDIQSHYTGDASRAYKNGDGELHYYRIQPNKGGKIHRYLGHNPIEALRSFDLYPEDAQITELPMSYTEYYGDPEDEDPDSADNTPGGLTA